MDNDSAKVTSCGKSFQVCGPTFIGKARFATAVNQTFSIHEKHRRSNFFLYCKISRVVLSISATNLQLFTCIFTDTFLISDAGWDWNTPVWPFPYG